MSDKPMIDLTRHHFVYHIGDVSLYGSWVFNEDQEAEEPALVLIPRYRRTGFKPVVIALSALFKYNSPQYLAHVTPIIMQSLGFNDCLSNAHKIASLIYDHLDDLAKMPPSPTTSIIVGEATFNMGGRKHSIQMLDHEPTPQA